MQTQNFSSTDNDMKWWEMSGRKLVERIHHVHTCLANPHISSLVPGQISYQPWVYLTNHEWACVCNRLNHGTMWKVLLHQCSSLLHIVCSSNAIMSNYINLGHRITYAFRLIHDIVCIKQRLSHLLLCWRLVTVVSHPDICQDLAEYYVQDIWRGMT